MFVCCDVGGGGGGEGGARKGIAGIKRTHSASVLEAALADAPFAVALKADVKAVAAQRVW